MKLTVLYVFTLMGLGACATNGRPPEHSASSPQPAVDQPKPNLKVTSAAVESGTPEASTNAAQDPVIGDWEGAREFKGFKATFKADHTFSLYDSWDAGKGGEFQKGKWSISDGKYAMAGSEPARTARISVQGQMSITADDYPGSEIILDRPGQPRVTVSPGKPPLGEWRYAYTSKSMGAMASGPPFDIMTFTNRGKVHLVNSIRSKEFDRDFEISGDVLSILTGEPSLPSVEFSFRWAEAESKLLFGIKQAKAGSYAVEWAFLKPEQFTPTSLEGTWITPPIENEFTSEYEFTKDGGLYWVAKSIQGVVLRGKSPKFRDYYRLWPAPFGTAMTIVVLNPEMGVQMTSSFKYEKSDVGIIMTPVEPQDDGQFKLMEEARQTWKPK